MYIYFYSLRALPSSGEGQSCTLFCLAPRSRTAYVIYMYRYVYISDRLRSSTLTYNLISSGSPDDCICCAVTSQGATIFWRRTVMYAILCGAALANSLDSTTDSLVFISSTAVLFASWPYFFGIELAEVCLIYLQLSKLYTIDMLIARFDSTTDSLVFISSTAILFASWPYFFGIELAEVYLIYLQLRKCYTIDMLIDIFDTTTDGLMCVFSRPYCSLHGPISSASSSQRYALYICSYVNFVL